MGKRDFPGHDVVGSASDQSRYGCAVMRGSERSLPDKASGCVSFSGNRIYLACLKGFFKSHRRQNPRHSLGERTFAGSGRANEYNVMSSGSGDLHPSFGPFLSYDFRKVHGSMTLGLLFVNNAVFRKILHKQVVADLLPAEYPQYIIKVVHSVHIDSFIFHSFHCGSARKNASLKFGTLCQLHDRQGT